MHYLIDGYNFLFRIPQARYPTFEKRRKALINLLDKELAPIKGIRSIIFDSADKLEDYAQTAVYENIEVLFAPRGQTADEYMIELVETNRNPKILVVVTSDNDLGRQCKEHGAKILSIEEFIAFITKKGADHALEKESMELTKGELDHYLSIFEEKLSQDDHQS